MNPSSLPTPGPGPTLPRISISRQQLVERVRAATQGRLTLIVGAPGSGKSVLLAQLIGDEIERPVAWIGVEPGDAGPERFAPRLLAALRSVDPTFAPAADDLVDPTGSQLGAPFVAALSAALVDLPEVLVVIDDFHLLSQPEATEIAQVVETGPANVHVVVATRVDPSPLFRSLVLLGETERFEQSDLALSPADEARLIEQVAGRSLAAHQLQALRTRTEGWMVAVQIAALAMRFHRDVDTFIDEYQGRHHDVAQYLMAEVVGREEPEIQDFLQRLSVVDRFCAPLAKVLTGRSDSVQVLEELDRRSLLMVRLDKRRQWFRFHPLLAELFQSRLHDNDPELERRLLIGAAHWFEEQGDLLTAGDHLVRGKAWDELLNLAVTYAWDLYERGYVASTLRWTQAVPSHILRDRPDAALVVATQLRTVGESAGCEALLAELEYRGVADPGTKAWIDMLVCLGVQHETPLDEVLRRAAAVDDWVATHPRVVDDQPTGLAGMAGVMTPAFIAMRCDVAAGRAHAYLDDLEPARERLRRATTGHAWWPSQVSALGSLAHLEAHAGELNRAVQFAGEALIVAHNHGLDRHECCADAHLALAIVARERNDPLAAERALDEAGQRAQQTRRLALMAMHRAEVALLALATEQAAAYLNPISEFRRENEGRLAPPIAARLMAGEARLLIATGQPRRARRLLINSYQCIDTLSAVAHLAVTTDDVALLRSTVMRWPASLSLRAAIEHDVRRANLALLEHDDQAAWDAMSTALRRAETNGQVRSFLDAGDQARQLVLQHRDDRASAAHARTVSDAEATRATGQILMGLTNRERTILEHLALPDSNQAIAHKLFISPNTLKTHLRHLYRKLGVSNRREAVYLARQQHLLTADD